MNLRIGTMLTVLLLGTVVEATSISITTKYGDTGGIVGPLNNTTDKVNGREICPNNPTAGCDFDADPKFNNNNTVDDSSDDSYNGDLLVRTNDAFQAVAAWNWNDGTDDVVTITGILPLKNANAYYEWTELPGSCDPIDSSISADKQTVICVRRGFDSAKIGTKAEDLTFNIRVLGGTPSGTQPGDITFKVEADGAISKTDTTDGNSLTVTAAPRWNLQKSMYTTYAGKEYDIDGDGNMEKGWILDYKFYIESDEVSGETDSVNPIVGNESMGKDATFTFTDDMSGLPPHAKMVGCGFTGAYNRPNQTNNGDGGDGYDGSADPLSFNGVGSIYGDSYPERHIPQPKNEQTLTCTQSGNSIAIKAEHIDATLNHYPTKSYAGNDLPVNRAIAAMGNIYIFIPLDDVKNGENGIFDDCDKSDSRCDDGEFRTHNVLKGFDPTTPTGHSNFGDDTESEKDNAYDRTLYYATGSWSKRFRGGGNTNYNGRDNLDYVYGYTGSGDRSGDGMVTKGAEFSTWIVTSNTGGTPFSEDTTCDVIDAYRLKIQPIKDNKVYTNIGNRYTGGVDLPYRYYIWNDDSNYTDGVTHGGLNPDNIPIPYIVEYATTYVDDSFLPSKGGDTTVEHRVDIERECTDDSVIWTTDFEEAMSGPIGITKVRTRLKPGVEVPSGSGMYFWINHKIREIDLATNQPMQSKDLIVNYAGHKFNYGNWYWSDYKPGIFPGNHSGWNGDRVIYTGPKVRIKKHESRTAAAPGDEVTYTLEMSYTNDTGLYETGQVNISDVLPKDLKYQTGSVSPMDIFGEPTIGTCNDVLDINVTPCVEGENQVLLWDLGEREVNAPQIEDLNYTVLIGAAANVGVNTNVVKIISPTDVSPISQRKADIGLTINVPASINIVKSTEENSDYPSKRERTTEEKDIFFLMDMRNGKDGDITDLDVIDILPFKGDGEKVIHFNDISVSRNVATSYHGSIVFHEASFAQHPSSSSECDYEGKIQYYYTNHDPKSINIAPTVGDENDVSNAASIWCEGDENGPNGCNGLSNKDVTAVRVRGARMEKQAICQFRVKLTVKDNLEGDNYSNSAGASATGVTLPVLSNALAVPVVGSSLGDKVWYDRNADGIQDAEEVGLAGLKVKLLDANGNPVKDPANPTEDYVITTDANGNYEFIKLNHGDYKVEFEKPAGYIVSPTAKGGNSAMDSNVDATTMRSETVTLGVKDKNPTIDAGFFTPMISGNVFDDGNGDDTINGTKIASADATPLFATLLDDQGAVLASTPIAADGSYAFDAESGVRANSNYTVVLSKEKDTTTSTLPADWNHADGEHIGTNEGTDGIADGIIIVSVLETNVPQVNFGINKKPLAENMTEAPVANPGGVVKATVPTLKIADKEDGTPSTITVTELPSNGTLYYNGTAVVAGEAILNADPSKFTVDPVSGDQTLVFKYTTTDKVGVVSDPATVTLPFFVVLPEAEDDNKSNPDTASPTNPTTQNILADDTNGTYQLNPNSVKFVNSGTDTLVVAGEGTWSYDATTGEVKFTPEAGFTGDPTPVAYTVADTEGNTVQATVAVDYPQHPPVATDDNKLGTILNTTTGPVQQPVTFNVVTDDNGNGVDSDPENDLDISTFVFTDGLNGSTIAPNGKSVVVPGEGTWTVAPNGDVTFTPEAGFLGNPTPVKYKVYDTTGLVSNEANITVTYPDVRKISGNVGIDITKDAVVDRVPLEPVTMTLKDESGAVIATTKTDAQGNYSFDVAAGKYSVIEADPANTTSVKDVDSNVTGSGTSDGGNDNTISNIDVTSQDSPHNNFIDEPVLGNVKGQVFKDENRDGQFTGAETVTLSNMDILVTDVYGVEHKLSTDRDGKYDLTGLPVGSALVSVNTADPDLNEGATPTTVTLNTVQIPVNDYAEQDFGFFIPPVTDSDPKDLATCAYPSSITWEGATVSSASKWHDINLSKTEATAKEFMTVGDKNISVKMYVTDINGQFNYEDAGTNEVNNTSNYVENGVFGQPYLTFYLGLQTSNTIDNPKGGELKKGDSATLTLDFNESIILDNWRVRDLDSGDIRNNEANWNWQDAVKMEAYDENGKFVALKASIGSGTNLKLTDGFYHTDSDNNASVLEGKGTDANSPTGHIVYSSAGIPISKIVVTHAAGPDIAEQTRSALGLSGFAVCTPIYLSGTIYNDGNGSDVDGTPIATPSGEQLFVNLVDDNGMVVDTLPVNVDGTYEFYRDIHKDTEYMVVLSSEEMTKGEPMVAPKLPENWNNSSEIDGSTNGVIIVPVASDSIEKRDFGINEKPVAKDIVDPIILNPGRDVGVMIQGADATKLTDSEDGVPRTITITELPDNATVEYNGTSVVLGQPILNFNPALLLINPANGDQIVVIKYTVTDNAGVVSDSATVTMSFKGVTISGNVFDDGDGDENVNGVDIDKADATPLYVTLLDNAGEVLASKLLDANGSYSFNGTDGVLHDKDYSVVLSTQKDAVTTKLPENWNNTGENLNNSGAGNDDNVSGSIAVSTTGLTVDTTVVPLVDFGINRKPEAFDVNKTVVLNPGGAVQVTVPDLNVSDKEDVVPTTVTIETLPNNAKVYYDGVEVTTVKEIKNFDQSKLMVDPENADQNVSFTYSTTDRAGVKSDPATIIMPFMGVTISGTLFDDGNGDGNVNGVAISEANGTALFVTLMDANGTVLATQPLDENGTYSFDGHNGIVSDHNYSIVLSTEANGTTPSLPDFWNNTGENINSIGAGDDHNVSGTIEVTTIGLDVNRTEVPLVDFGINKAPTAASFVLEEILNRGKDIQVPLFSAFDTNLIASPIADREDGKPTTVTIKKLPTNGQLFYDGQAVVAGVPIENLDMSKFTVDPNDGPVTMVLEYTTTDRAGVESNVASITIPFREVKVLGTVYNDGNANGNVDGQAISAPSAVQLYATLLDENGDVLASYPLNADGTYEFNGVDGVIPNSDYKVVVSQENRANSSKLPINWNNDGEMIGLVGTDGANDGMLSVRVEENDVPLVNFAINKKPVAGDETEPLQLNPGTGVKVDVPDLNITDLEDNTTKLVTIKTLPINGTLYYDGVVVVKDQNFTDFNNSLLTIDPVNGDTTVSFTYTTTDGTGVESDVATVDMSFDGIEISGNIFSDGNADETVNGTKISRVNATPLFATLVDANGTVMATMPIDANGHYEFTGNNGIVPDHNYNIVLSTEANATTPSLPANWNNTDGEHIGTDKGLDGASDGVIAVEVKKENIEEINFGINERPVTENAERAVVPNPGGDDRVQVLDLVSSDNNAVISVTIKTLPSDGVLYYDGVEVVAGQVIPNFDNKLLMVDPKNGNQTIEFEYTATDVTGWESEPSTIKMPFSHVPAKSDFGISDDSVPANFSGPATVISVLSNDTVGNGSTIHILDSNNSEILWQEGTAVGGASVTGTQSYKVPGEGTWTVEGGNIVFTAESGFKGVPTPIYYVVEDRQGNFSNVAQAEINSCCQPYSESLSDSVDALDSFSMLLFMMLTSALSLLFFRRELKL